MAHAEAAFRRGRQPAAKRPSAPDWEGRSLECSRAPHQPLDGCDQCRRRPSRSKGPDGVRPRCRRDIAPCRFESRRHNQEFAIRAPSSRSYNEREANSARILVPRKLKLSLNPGSRGPAKNLRRRAHRSPLRETKRPLAAGFDSGMVADTASADRPAITVLLEVELRIDASEGRSHHDVDAQQTLSGFSLFGVWSERSRDPVRAKSPAMLTRQHVAGMQRGPREPSRSPTQHRSSLPKNSSTRLRKIPAAEPTAPPRLPAT